MKRHHNAPTMQTVQRIDSGLPYHTLNTRRLKAASPLQTVLPAQRRIGLVSIVLIALIVILLALAINVSSAHHPLGVAHAQNIGEPWCQISHPPALPASPEPPPGGGELVEGCIQPRVYLPEIHISSLAAGVLLPR